MTKDQKNILTRDEFCHKFAMKLDKLMRAKQISNRALAIRADISPVSIGSYRNEKTIPDIYVAYRISKALPCTIEALMDF